MITIIDIFIDKRHSTNTIHLSQKFAPVRKLSKAFSRLFSSRQNSESDIKRNILKFDSDNDNQSGHSKRSSQRRHTGLFFEFFSLSITH